MSSTFYLMYLVKTPLALKKMYPRLLWNHERDEKKLYLTFDDGPTPEITKWIIDTLASYNAKATFFCIGNNIEKYPEIFEQLLANDHAIGNHTNKHENGWKTNLETYMQSTHDAQKIIDNHIKPQQLLFRPPYGRIKKQQIKALRQKGYTIIMWDVLSADFDTRTTPEASLSNVINNAQEGSIIVFHDSIKAKEKLQYVLPKVLEHFSDKGYSFERLY